MHEFYIHARCIIFILHVPWKCKPLLEYVRALGCYNESTVVTFLISCTGTLYIVLHAKEQELRFLLN